MDHKTTLAKMRKSPPSILPQRVPDSWTTKDTKFRGNNCEEDINECASFPCKNNGSCKELTPNNYNCQCAPGYSGSQCEQEIDECLKKPCPAYQICIDLVNDFRCRCPIGYFGNFCNSSDCRLFPCSNGGSCIMKENAYTCVCQPPFTGEFCNTSQDVCIPNPCLFGGTCFHYNQTQFGCVCSEGYIGARCEADIFDCLSNPCLNGGSCLDGSYASNVLNLKNTSMSVIEGMNRWNKFVCSCTYNYTGVYCETKIEACMSSPCQHDGNCSSLSTTDYTCECVEGWKGSECSENINECLVIPSVCRNDGQCIDLTPGFLCACTDKWTGKYCETDVIDCQPFSCVNGGTCLEESGGFSCVCSTGYTGHNCSERMTSCEPNPCKNNATCSDGSSSANFTCTCLPGFTGQVCDGNIDECTISKPCFNNATCLDAINGFTCICSNGWTGIKFETDIDDCLHKPCMNGGTCVDTLGGFICICPLGYTNVTCNTEINECSFQPCRNNATCLDLVNSFHCQCLPGFTGVTCEENINDCLTLPCASLSTCLDGINNYTCLCPPGLQGQQCTVDIQECLSSPCLNGGYCIEPALAIFTCVCPSGLEGQYCDIIRTATFTGNSSLSFTTSRVTSLLSTAMITIYFTISSTVLDGILLLVTGVSTSDQPQHVSLELDNGVLYLSSSNGIHLMSSLLELPSGLIHNYVVLLSIDHMTVSVTMTSNTDKNTLSTSVQLTNETVWKLNRTLNCGGVSVWSPYIRNIFRNTAGFTGCLGNLMINSQLIDLAEANQFSPVDQVSAPTVGCAGHIPCSDVICRNGGTCLDMWIYRRCQCLPGYSGLFCEIQNMAHFEDSNMLYFGGDLSISSLSFEVTSRNTSGLVLYTLMQDKLSISLNEDQLRIHLISSDSLHENIQNVGNKLHLQGWVTITIQFIGYLYIMNVSSKTDLIGSVTGSLDHNITVVKPVFLGQLHPHSVTDIWRNRNQISLPGDMSFQGCVRNILINQSLLDLSTSTATTLGNDPPKARPGCIIEETCVNITCEFKGHCVSDWTGATCLCQEGFMGDNCSEATSVTFNGKSSYSFIQFDRTKFPFGEDGTLSFRTRQQICTVMLMQLPGTDGISEKYIEIRIFNEKLQVYSHFSTVAVEFKKNISDGKWHSLHWTRKEKKIVVDFENETILLDANFDLYNLNLSNQVNIFLGARPFYLGNTSSLIGYFKGCIGEISFNNIFVMLTQNVQSEQDVTVADFNITVGCQSDPACQTSPCPANSYCVDEWNMYVCQCMAGWEGDQCTINTDDCQNNSCLNGALCRDQVLNYTCDCLPGFTGQFCETITEACDNSTCVVNQTISCLPANNSHYVCLCVAGFSGQFCETALDQCSPSSCLNSGTCIQVAINITCLCPSGYTGQYCQTLDSCSSRPCFNGGKCLLAESSSTNSSYICQCVWPFYGAQCQNYNYCVSFPCQNNSTCLEYKDIYNCNCTEGYYGSNCQYHDQCSSKPCFNGGVCRLNQNSYVCLCPWNYSGRNCELPVNVCTFNICWNGGTCVYGATESDSNSTYCHCVNGFIGSHCETDVNECDNEPCLNSGTCIDSRNFFQTSHVFVGFHCVCLPGYTGLLCADDIDECKLGLCENNSTCIDKINDYKCVCGSNFTGRNCNITTRGCVSSPCVNNATCTDIEDSYVCQCLQGFTGKNCDQNIDDCQNIICKNNGFCKDGINQSSCICLPGYTGELCEVIQDSCYSQPCYHNGRCYHQGVCSCPDVVQHCGWSDEKCQLERCNNRSDCHILLTSYLCNCSGTGYTGVQCTADEDECLCSPCLHNGICVNSASSFSCHCQGTGYLGDLCQVDNDECMSQDVCFNGGKCLNTPGSYLCECTKDWTGPTCGQNKDDCEKNPCNNGGLCLDLVSGYLCNCTGTGFQGINCTDNIDDCYNNRCANGGVCIDGTRQYTCNCNQTSFTGQFCETNLNSCKANGCQNNGVCQNGVTCNCSQTGYKGDFCQTDIDECFDGTHGCMNGSKCMNIVGSYYCECSATATGSRCEFTLLQTPSQSLSNGTIATITVLVIILAIVVVVTVIWILLRRQSTRGVYKPSEVERHVLNEDIKMSKLSSVGREQLI
ncbi:hypothetical protein Btru_025002 [Bulinus truncatus]|nr:hypothetical protein Btru_025002 [Bulinus truncatus]